MEKKKIKCPSCGVMLEVTNSQNEEEKLIKCPRCGKQLRVRFQKTDDVMDASTCLGNGTDGARTQLAHSDMSAAKAFIVYDGKEYELGMGLNIVGRKAASSTADVQIDTDDRYISRHNAIIRVKRVGGQLLVTITNHKNQNPIQVGTVILQEGDEVMLHDGDEITMGVTKMRVKIS